MLGCNVLEIRDSWRFCGMRSLQFFLYCMIKNCFRGEELIEMNNSVFSSLNAADPSNLTEVTLIQASRASTRWQNHATAGSTGILARKRAFTAAQSDSKPKSLNNVTQSDFLIHWSFGSTSSLTGQRERENVMCCGVRESVYTRTKNSSLYRRKDSSLPNKKLEFKFTLRNVS